MEIRPLNGTDVFSAVRLINKIGIKKLKEKLQSDRIKEIFGNTEEDTQVRGFEIISELLPDVLDLVADAEDEFFTFLSGIANTDLKTMKTLPLDELMDVLVQLVESKEFVGFYKGVSRLVNRKTA